MKEREKTFTASKFKQNACGFLTSSAPGGDRDKRGKPIAKVTPVAALDNERFYGCMKARVVIKGDIFSTGRTRPPKL
jgi:hypothetical protein